MPTSPNGALGSLDYKKEERRTLAIKSREASPKFGTPERQKLIDEVKNATYSFLLDTHSVIYYPDRTLLSQIHEYMLSKAPPVPQLSHTETSEDHPRPEEAESQVSFPNPENLPEEEGIDQVGNEIIEEQVVPANANPAETEASRENQSSVSRNQLDTRVQNLQPQTTVQKPKPDDRLFTWAAIGLTIAIVVLLLKKFIKSTEHGPLFFNGS
jgi:ubiquitin-conjugating enzyme E2 J1